MRNHRKWHRAREKEKVQQRMEKQIIRRGKGKHKEEESALFSPLKVTEMPGHLHRLHQIKCTHFHKCASAHNMHITVSPTVLSTTTTFLPAFDGFVTGILVFFIACYNSVLWWSHVIKKILEECVSVHDMQLMNFWDMTSKDQRLIV